MKDESESAFMLSPLVSFDGAMATTSPWHHHDHSRMDALVVALSR